MTDPKDLYLDLMKRILLNTIYGDQEDVEVEADSFLKRQLVGRLRARKLRVMRRRQVNLDARTEGTDWPSNAHTMVGMRRLENLQQCVQDVIANNVPGDLIETGVWRGGSSIFMRAVLKAGGVTDRTVWVADSFAGLPPPNPEKYPADLDDPHHTFDNLAVPLETVKANFAKYDLLDDRVQFLKGWFSETLHKAPIESLAVMRLDGDMYESTMDALTALYPKLSPGGYAIIDDYGAIPGCKKAVDDFRRQNGIGEEMTEIDWTGTFWRRRK